MRYKFKLLLYTFNNLKGLIVRQFYFIIYVYSSSIMLMFLGDGVWYAIENVSPRNALYYLYQHIKWCFNNNGNVGYGIPIRMLVAFFIPYFIYQLLIDFKWLPFLKKRIVKVFEVLQRKKKSVNGCSTKSVSNNVEYTIDIIKQLLIKDIEEAIDKRLRDIFIDQDTSN